MSNVVYLHGEPERIGQFLRVGPSNHRQLEALLAAGKLPFERFVICAGTASQQSELVAALRQAGHELCLDTNVAELSVVGRFDGVARGAPWADHTGVLSPAHFGRGPNEFDVVGRVARFAIENGFRRVQAPTHWISGVSDPWFGVDLSSCQLLRRLLDEGGGKGIKIDYPVIVSKAVFDDAAERRAIANALANVPLDSIWLRISSFGADATGVGVRKYVVGASEFHGLGAPIVADFVGGLASLALASFGAVAAFAHGVASNERCDTTNWNNPRSSSGGGGGYTILVPGLDRLLKQPVAEALMKAPGGRRLLSCNNPLCCPGGFEDTLKDPKSHYLRQRKWQCDEVSEVPEPRRIQHFLDKNLSAQERRARQATKLKVEDERISEMLVKSSARLTRMSDVLRALEKAASGLTRSPPLGGPNTTYNQKKQDRRP